MMTTDQGKQHQKIHRGGGEEVGASLKSGHRQYRRASVLNTLLFHFRPLPILSSLAVAPGIVRSPREHGDVRRSRDVESPDPMTS